MRFSEFKILTEAAKVGREYQHLEDLVFVDGSAGATKAVHILNKLGHDSKDIAIKWDGYPTMYWGRDNNGEFVLVGKNGWMKGNISKSAKELYSFITSTGKGEEWRDRFAKEMATIFNHFDCEVTLVEYLDEILPPLDKDIKKRARNLFKRSELNIYTKSALKKVIKNFF